MSQSGVRLYVCENCGRLGVMADFQDECRPGWTHGRLVRVEEVSHAAVGAVADESTPRGHSEISTKGVDNA